MIFWQIDRAAMRSTALPVQYMGEVVKLVFNRGYDPRITMANILATYSAAKIDVALALDIPDFGIFCPLGNEG